jgi:hypothetical protein
MLRDRHGGVGRFAAHQRLHVRRGGHDHGARQALGTQIVLEKLADFASAFADQRQDDHIAHGIAGQHGQQARLADAGAGEQADALTLAAGGKGVEHVHAEIEPWSEPGAAVGFRRIRADVPAGLAHRKFALAI